ncbi:hypothetical protein SLA2020_472630 [Shorea laevis]
MKNDNHEEDTEDMNSDSVKSNSRKRSSHEDCEVREAAVEVELQPSCVGISESNSQADDSLAEPGSWIKNKSRFRKTMQNSFENAPKLPEEIGSSSTDQMNILSTAFIPDVGNSTDNLISLHAVEANGVSVALENNGYAHNQPDKGGSSTKGIDILSNLVSDVRDGEEKSLSTDAEKTEESSLAITKKEESRSITLQSSIARPPVSNLRKNLLVLDLNGLLADIVFPAPKDYSADTNISGKAVFKRPFCDDFLNFCFERFEVGVWSSRTRKNVDRVIDFLLGDMKQKLLFCWDSSYCTATQFKTLENQHKPLVFKELRKLWDKHDADLPWEKGFYNESNTLLLDDTPYKALLNPPHTAIFPYSYKFHNENDNSLGSGGDLRVYLEGLAAAEDIQTFVEQNPFGQTPITESNDSWSFYVQVISTHVPSEVQVNSDLLA